MRRLTFLKFFISVLLCVNISFSAVFSSDLDNNKIGLDVIVTPKKPFVQSQVLYQLKIYYDIDISAASIYPPYADNTIIKTLGSDQSYTKKIDGKSYHVYQRNFLIFPQNTGELVIRPAIFRAIVTEKTKTPAYPGFSSLDLRPMQLIAPTVKLFVRPVPAAAGAHWWLPTENLAVTETWSTTTDQIQQGVPLNRTITLQATNLMASQLPQISSESTSAYNSYPEQPRLSDTISNNKLLGIKTEKIVYIPNVTGTVNFPAMTIYWWNTKTDTLTTSNLPAKSYNVLAGTNAPAIETTAPLVPTTLKPVDPDSKLWFIMSCIFSVLFFIILFSVWWFWRKKTFLTSSANSLVSYISGNHNKDSTANVTLKQACKTNDPHAAKKGLIHWAQYKFNQRHIFSIADILPLINDQDILQELHLLQNKLYKETNMAWSGKKLWQCIKAFKIKKTEAGKNSLDYLPLLNPKHLDMRKAD